MCDLRVLIRQISQSKISNINNPKGFAMLKEVTLPGISENVDSGEVIAVLVSVGDVVEKDQPVVELETEKAAFEVPSPERGRIAEINVKQGQTVKVGEVLVRLETDAEAAAKKPQPERRARGEASRKAAGCSAAEPEQPPPSREPPVRPPRRGRSDRAEEQQPVAAPAQERKPAVPVAAAPSVRQLARELGVDIDEVPGTGPGGRISPEDVKQYARSLIHGAPAPAQVTAGAPVQRRPGRCRTSPSGARSSGSP